MVGDESCFRILYHRTVILFSTLARKCPCKTCQDLLETNWPYNKALSANLLHLSGFPLSEVTEEEVRKFEKSIINDFIDSTDEKNVPSIVSRFFVFMHSNHFRTD